MQDCFLAGNYERVTGIMTALEACHCGSLFGQQVNDLSLALVAPLRAYDYYVLSHQIRPFNERQKEATTRSP